MGGRWEGGRPYMCKHVAGKIVNNTTGTAYSATEARGTKERTKQGRKERTHHVDFSNLLIYIPI